MTTPKTRIEIPPDHGRSTSDTGAPSPPRVRQQYVRDFIHRYTERTKGSKRMAQAYRARFADKRAASGFRFSTKEMVYPIVAARSAGARFWDVDGNEYVDLTMGFGTLLFGHKPPFIMEAIGRQLGEGIHIGPQSERAGRVAELVCKLTGMERTTFTVTGSEAIMIAVRLARACTGRSKIALFAGSYHGIYDGTMVSQDSTTGTPRAVPMVPGIAPQVAADVLVLDYGDPESLAILAARGHELAAVLVEPVQSSRPALQPREFLHDLRRVTRQTGTALIFDEMITGFRIHPGGAQAWFGVSADLATYGKAVAGGFPIGIIAGRAEYLDAIDGGFWSFGDDSYPGREVTWAGGTYIKHPLTMAIAHAVLSRFSEEGADLQARLNSKTRRLADTLNHYFEHEAIPVRVDHFGSMFRFVFRHNLDLFFYSLIHRGVYLWEQRLCFLSEAHTEADIDHVVRAVSTSVEEMRGVGFLNAR